MDLPIYCIYSYAPNNALKPSGWGQSPVAKPHQSPLNKSMAHSQLGGQQGHETSSWRVNTDRIINVKSTKKSTHATKLRK